MRRRVKWLIPLIAGWGAAGHADNPPPAPPAATTAPAANTEPSVPTGLSDADLQKMAEGETIEIYDERPDKPFDRDTEVRLTGEQLAARGATDLGSALDLLSDVIVRNAGRGGTNLDIRGARKGSLSIFIDGVQVSDPFYGTFDVSSIPITDIVQIRVATSAQSPIDGIGGPGGVIEVHTRDAIGSQLEIIRLTMDTLPTFGVTATSRVALAKRLGLRMSGSGVGGDHGWPLPPTAPGDVTNDNHSATGAARLEYRGDAARVAVDGYVDERHYVSPPSDEVTSAILLIDREETERATAKGDYQVDKLQLQGQASFQHLYRLSRFFSDPAMHNETEVEDLRANRFAGTFLATHPIAKEWRWAASASFDYESATVSDLHDPTVHGDVTVLEPAADLQYEHSTVRLDGAAGLAVPIGVGAKIWPEGKLVAHWRPQFGGLELTATVARKGRVPSLRERFDLVLGGNPDLAPEQSDLTELRAIEQLTDRLRFEIAPFYRHTTGLILEDPSRMMFENLNSVDFYGVDVLGRVRVHPMVELGGAYDFIEASSTQTGPDPLPRLPHNRGEGWVQVTPDPKISLLARVRYFGSTIDQQTVLPSNTTLEATATVPINRQYLAVLRADDLTNERPLVRAGYHALGRVIALVLQGTWE